MVEKNRKRGEMEKRHSHPERNDLQIQSICPIKETYP